MEITKEIAIKVRDTVDAGLVRGKGSPIPGQMCVEAAVCFAMGLPHSDEPPCVSPAIRALKIQLNDSAWSSDTARGKGMRRLALAQLGSAGVVDDHDFNRRVIEVVIRRFVPIALRAAASVRNKQEHKDSLEQAAVRCELEGNQEAARAASEAASEAARAASDRILAEFAECVVQVLIEMKAPGCQWLDLVPISPSASSPATRSP